MAGLVTVLAISSGADPTLVANIVGGGVTVMGALIALVAYQPPTLNPGDTFHINTPPGEPNAVTTVATPPAQDPPPVMVEP